MTERTTTGTAHIEGLLPHHIPDPWMSMSSHEQRVETQLNRIIELLGELILHSGATTTINVTPPASDIAKEVINILNAKIGSTR